MIIDHANDQRAGDYVVAEMAEKQKVNAVVSAAVENAKRQNKRINDRSDDHDVGQKTFLAVWVKRQLILRYN